MAIKKIEMRPIGDGSYSDILYPKTSIDMVENLQNTINSIQSDINTAEQNAIDHANSLNYTDVGAAPDGHTHDGRYYTEGQVDSKLAGKQDNLSGDQTRTITLGTSDPSGGSNGDIYLQYE